MSITLRQLRAFVAVAEAGQFTLAADRLCVTQSALSMLVKELERVLGVRLFDRHTRSVRLTSSGEAFLERGRRVLQELDEALQATRDLTTFSLGHVSLACATVLAALPRLAATSRRAAPPTAFAMPRAITPETCPTCSRVPMASCRLKP